MFDRLNGMSSEMRQFTLLNLAHHLYEGRQDEALYTLIDEPWWKAHLRYTGSNVSFAADVSLALQAAAASFPSRVDEVWRNVFIRSRLGVTATQIPSRILRLLAELGRHQQALDYTALVQDAFQRCLSYVHIGDVLAKRGPTSLARAVVSKALAAAEAETAVVSRAEALARVAGLAVRLRVEDALSRSLASFAAGAVGHWMEHVVPELTRELTTAGHRAGLLQILPMLRRFPHDDVNLASVRTRVYGAFASALAELRMQTELLELVSAAESLEDPSDRASTLASMVEALAGLGDPACVDRASRVPSGASPRARASLLEAAAVAYGLLGDHERSQALLDQAQKENASDGDAFAKINAAGQRSRAFARLRRYDDAIQMAGAIEKPQTRSQSLLAVGVMALESGFLEKATEIAHRSIEAARLVDPEDLWSEDMYAPVEAVVNAAELLWRVGEKEAALTAIRQMLNLPHLLCDPTYGPDALTTALGVLGRARDVEQLERALAIAVAIEDMTFRDRATIAALEALVDADQFERALEVAEEYDLDVRARVAEGLFESGRTREAEELVDRVLHSAEALQTSNVSAGPFQAIADELLAVGMLEHAQQVVDNALDAAKKMTPTSVGYVLANGEKALALARVATTLARLARFDDAIAIAHLALEEADPQEPLTRTSIKGEAFKSSVAIWGNAEGVLLETARSFTAAGRWEELLDISRDRLGPYGYAKIAAAVGRELLRLGDRSRAASIADSAWAQVRRGAQDASNDSSPAPLVALFIELASYDKAFEVAAAISDAETRVLELGRVASAPNPSVAIESATHAFRAARELEGDKRVAALAMCAKAFLDVGRPNDANETAEEVLSLMPRGRYVSSAWEALVSVYHRLKADGPNRALESGLMISDDAERASALRTMLPALAAVKDVQGISLVQKDLERIGQPADRASALVEVGRAFEKAGEWMLGLQSWQTACLTARDEGLEIVFRILGEGASTLAKIDDGKTLWNVYQRTVGVSQWGGAQRQSPEETLGA
jgi:tetratricopeptide (TPR) repeat protein